MTIRTWIFPRVKNFASWLIAVGGQTGKASVCGRRTSHMSGPMTASCLETVHDARTTRTRLSRLIQSLIR